jgi:RNA polymerase sigma factor (sigma-70 family)
LSLARHQLGMRAMAEDSASLELLVAGACAGDDAAFTRLVAAYHEDLLRVAFVITGDADMAADAAQLAWQTAWRKLRNLREPDRLRSWLVAIAANEARQLTRRQRRRSVVEIAVAPESSTAGEPTGAISRLDLTNAINRLTPDDRELIALRYVMGLDSFEIAAARGRSASGIRARIARVLAQLRRELDRD